MDTAVAAGVAVLIVGLVAWPYGVLTLLIGASAMLVFYGDVFGRNARPEHFAAVFALFAIGVWFGAGKKRPKLNPLDCCIYFFVGANFISSTLSSTATATNLRWALSGFFHERNG